MNKKVDEGRLQRFAPMVIENPDTLRELSYPAVKVNVQPCHGFMLGTFGCNPVNPDVGNVEKGV